MDKKNKSNIFESDDESDDESNKEYEEENYEDNTDCVIDDIDKVKISENDDGSEEEIFINPITGLEMTAEEATMELDPITGMPIYEQDEEEAAYMYSIVRDHIANSNLDCTPTDPVIVSRKKIKKYKDRKSPIKPSLFELLKDNNDNVDCKEGQFQSTRMLARKKELGLKSTVNKKKQYRYKLNSKFSKPIDRTFSKVRSVNNLISYESHNELFPSLI